MVPRVLMVQRDRRLDGLATEDAEPVIAADGEAAIALLRRQPFDTVLVDLDLAPLDGWCLLAAVGSWPDRPRLVAIVADRADTDRVRADVDRARVLGADLCVAAGTDVNARALERSTKETRCPRPLTTSSPRTTKAGVSA